MDTLIIIAFGAIVGGLVSKSRYDKHMDIAMGIFGALASGALISAFYLPGALGYNGYAYFAVMIVCTVATIYIGRSLMPRNTANKIA